MNFIDQISKGQSLIGRIDKTLPFLLMAVFCLLADRKIKSEAYVYAIIGILSTLLGAEDNATGAVFLIFSFYIFNKPITNLIISGLTLIVIVCKFMFLEFTISQAVNMILAYVYIFTIYYILIHPKPKQTEHEPKIIIRPDLKPIDIYIVQQIHKGISRKAIAFDCKVNKTMIDSRIKQLKKKLKTTTTIEMLNECLKVGIMNIEVDRRELT